MSKAKFVFEKFKNSFSVKVENLEELSVDEIQKIQSFVQKRNGVFRQRFGIIIKYIG